MAAMDDDMLIVLGFALAAVALMVLVFIWVIVYCLCCRENSRSLSKSNTCRPLIYYPNRGSYPDQHSYTNSNRFGELPELPSEGKDSPPLPPDHPSGRKTTHGHTNAGFEGEDNDEIYSYCDSLRYQAPVPHDSHAYEDMPAADRSKRSPQLTVQYTVDESTLQRDCYKISRKANRPTSDATEAYVDINHHQLVEDYEEQENEDNTNTFIRKLSVVLCVDETEEPTKTTILKQKTENEIEVEVLADNEVSFVNSEMDKVSNVSSSDDQYRDLCAVSIEVEIEDNSDSTGFEDKEDCESLSVDVTGSDSDEEQDEDYCNFSASSLSRESVDLQPISLQDNDLYQMQSESESFSENNSSKSDDEEVNEISINNSTKSVEKFISEEACGRKNKITPTPKPRKMATSDEQIQQSNGPISDDSSTRIGAPEPRPRTNRALSNPPSYDQIVDYGQ